MYPLRDYIGYLRPANQQEAERAEEACFSVVGLMASLEQKCQVASQFEHLVDYSAWWLGFFRKGVFLVSTLNPQP